MTGREPRDARQALAMRSQVFFARAASLGLDPDPRWFWYHTIDLGRGLVTPGSFDYRAVLPRFGLPDRLEGRRALDIGAASGFFSLALGSRLSTPGAEAAHRQDAGRPSPHAATRSRTRSKSRAAVDESDAYRTGMHWRSTAA